jgi:hypothetical protein
MGVAALFDQQALQTFWSINHAEAQLTRCLSPLELLLHVLTVRKSLSASLSLPSAK